MIAMLSEQRALTEALKTHSLLLEQHVRAMQEILAAGHEIPPLDVQGVLGHLGKAFSPFVDPPDPPKRRRR